MKIYLRLILFSLIANTLYAADVSGIISQYPGENQKQVQQANAEFIKAGPAAIKEICGMLVPYAPQKDIKARYALNGIARYVTRTGAESERMMTATALCETLPTLNSYAAKEFVIVLLERCGKDESVATLLKYSAEPKLCEAAVHALVSINSPLSTKALNDALAKTQDNCKIKVIHAIGIKHYKPASRAILAIAAGSKAGELHEAALTALAGIAPADADATLYSSISGTKGYDYIHAVARYRRYGKNLLSQNQNRAAAKVFVKILKISSDTTNSKLISGIQGGAADGLVAAAGEQAAGTLVSICPGADFALRSKIADLAETMQSYEEVYAALAKEDIYFKYRLLAFKGSRGDSAGTASLLAAMKDDKVNRDRIYPLTRRLDKGIVTDALIGLCEEDENQEQTTVWILEMPGSVLYPKIKAVWPQASPTQLRAFIKVIESRKALDFEDILLAELDKNSKVKTAAIAALGSMESRKAVSKISKSYASSTSPSERKKALRVIAGFCKKSGNINDLTVLMVSPQSKAEILPFLASIGGEDALNKTTALIKSSDPAVQEAAIRALLKWKQDEAINPLLKLAETTESEKYNAMAVGSVTRLASMNKNSDSLRILVSAFAVAKRPQEKSAVQSAMLNIMMDKSFKSRLNNADKELVKKAAALLDNQQKTKLKSKFGGIIQ
jgi:HEAT repeat protein